MTTTNRTSFYCTDSAFFAALVETNLRPVLAAAMPQTAASAAQQSPVLPAWLTGDNLDTFLQDLQPDIARLARSLYYRVRDTVSVDLADMAQEGMIGAWLAAQRYDAAKVVDESSFVGYCVKHARGAMLAHLRGLHPAISLDSDIETEDGAIRRELADTSSPRRQVSSSQRRRILAGLRKLSRIERLAICATYRIADQYGRVPSWNGAQVHLHRSESALYQARTRGLRKLASLLQ